jgi:anthranilate synthase/aminodeoxychorismate synthase-like glutamine amidotransferase
MILLIDNFDSFTYNLAHTLFSLNQEVKVVRNNQISHDKIINFKPRAIFISPGPGRPENSGITPLSISLAQSHGIPIFGVCLGMQAIGAAFGARIVHAPVPMHGKISHIEHTQHPLFSHIESPFPATRYHSLIVDAPSLPKNLSVIATSQGDQSIMALAHEELPLAGVQFHPESIASPSGIQIIANFLSLHNIPFSLLKKENA